MNASEQRELMRANANERTQGGVMNTSEQRELMRANANERTQGNNLSVSENYGLVGVSNTNGTRENVSLIPTDEEYHKNFNKQMKQLNCDDILEHLHNCSECQKYLENKYKSDKIYDLFSINPQLKETIIVFLIGILILMILNLFYK